MKPVYLRTLRERRKLTQEELSRASRVAQNTISKLEVNRRANPWHATVVALAVALGVAPEQLRFGPEPTRRRRRAREAA